MLSRVYIHTIKSFKECLQMHKLQKNREKVEAKVGPEVHAIIKGDLCRRTSDTLYSFHKGTYSYQEQESFLYMTSNKSQHQ